MLISGTHVSNCSLLRNFASSIVAQLTGAYALPLLFKTVKRTQIALTLRAPRVSRADLGVMLKHNYWMVALLGTFVPQVLHPRNILKGCVCCWGVVVRQVVNYDVLRATAKDSFADEIGEVRGYVSKLQKAQRAGEQALDMYDSAWARRRLRFSVCPLRLRFQKRCSA